LLQGGLDPGLAGVGRVELVELGDGGLQSGGVGAGLGGRGRGRGRAGGGGGGGGRKVALPPPRAGGRPGGGGGPGGGGPPPGPAAGGGQAEQGDEQEPRRGGGAHGVSSRGRAGGHGQRASSAVASYRRNHRSGREDRPQGAVREGAG